MKKLTPVEEAHFFFLGKLKESHIKKADAEAEIKILENALKSLDTEQGDVQ